MQAGYDCVLKLINISPDFNLLEFGLGINTIVAFDEIHKPKKDNFGNVRPVNGRITPGFELNWSLRIYIIPIPPVKGRVFLEGLGMSLVVYAREFPDTAAAKGTHVNIGSHAGLGMEFPVNTYKVYSSLRLFHSSNGMVYAKNPELNAIGILVGVQFK